LFDGTRVEIRRAHADLLGMADALLGLASVCTPSRAGHPLTAVSQDSTGFGSDEFAGAH